MATKTKTIVYDSEENTKKGSNTTWGIDFLKLKNLSIEKIPKYSKIDSVNLKCDLKRDGQMDAFLVFNGSVSFRINRVLRTTNDDGTYSWKSEIEEYATITGGASSGDTGITTSFKTFSTNKDTTFSNYLKGYMNSEKENVCTIDSGNVGNQKLGPISISYGTGVQSFNYTIRNREVIYKITLPTLTINSSAGGTVSNSGTYNIDKEDTSDSITSITCTANPDNGYRFLQWSDGDKRRTRPFTETDLTSSNTRIVAEFIPIHYIETDLKNGYFKDTSLYDSPGFWIDQYGLWDEKQEKNTATGDIVLQTPIRAGYTFKYWVNADTGEKFENVTISVSTTVQDLSYYAEWELNSYNLTAEVNPSDAGVLTIKYEDVDYGANASVKHGTTFSLISNHNNLDKYTHLGIEEIINGNLVKTYLPSDNISKLKITSDLSNKTKIHYKSNYSLNQWGIGNIIYYIYNESSRDYIKTSEICGNIEVNGILHTNSSLYFYDSEARLVFIPKFGYNLDYWEIMFEETKTFNTLVAENIIFKKTNDIKIYLKKVNMQENSIPDGADSSSAEVKSVTRSIVNRTIENYIENVVPLKRIGQYAFYKCNNLQNFLINQCDIIQNNAFEGCKKLNSIKLPRALGLTQRRIQSQAFKNCENLMTIIIPGEDLVLLEDVDAFNGTPLQIDRLQSGIGYIYVHDKSKYEVGSTEDEQTNWSVFTGHFRNISDYPEICGEEII